jgi:hypothetical protein
MAKQTYSSPTLWFRSNAFPIEPGEDAAVNPGRYGKALAHWIREEVLRAGFPGAQIGAEDWGWIVILDRQEDTISFVGCSNRDGQTTEWGVFLVVEERRSMLAWLRKREGKVSIEAQGAQLWERITHILQTAPDAHDFEVEDYE